MDRARRGIFTSLLSRSTPAPLRPPYGANEELFRQECPSCVDAPCVAVCEEAVIGLREDGTPALVLEQSGCTFCQACAKACPKEVLCVTHPETILGKVAIDTAACLAWNGVVCATCKEVCGERAITFFGLYRPVVSQETCTACGFCYGVCPTRAVQIKRRGE